MRRLHFLLAVFLMGMLCFDLVGQERQSSNVRLTALPQNTDIAGTTVLSRDGNLLIARDKQGLAFFDTVGKRRGHVQGDFLKIAVAPISKTQAAGCVAALEKQENFKERGDTALLLHIFNSDGTPRARLLLPYGFDEPLPQFCFDLDGTHLLLANPATATLTFLSSRGEVLQRVDIFKDAPFSLERPMFLTAGESTFVVLSQFEASTPVSQRAPTVSYFSSDGAEKWRRSLPPATAAGAVISADGRRLAACRYSVNESNVEASTTIFDQTGNQLGEVPVLFRHARFTTNAEKLVLASRERIMLVDSGNGKVLVDKKVSTDGEIISTLTVDEKQNVVALVGRSQYANGGFQLVSAALLGINANGDEIFRHPVQTGLRAPTLAYNESRHELVLAADGILQRFRIEVIAQ